MNTQQPQANNQVAQIQQYQKELGELVGLLTEIRDMASQFSILLPQRTRPIFDRVNAKLKAYGR